MDSLEFIHRFREAQQDAGNRPVQVVFRSSPSQNDVSIHYEAAPLEPMPECQVRCVPSRIVITYPR